MHLPLIDWVQKRLARPYPARLFLKAAARIRMPDPETAGNLAAPGTHGLKGHSTFEHYWMICRGTTSSIGPPPM